MERSTIAIMSTAIMMFIFVGAYSDSYDYGGYDSEKGERDYRKGEEDGWDKGYEEGHAYGHRDAMRVFSVLPANNMGIGRITYESGENYVGQLNADRHPHGLGVFVYKNGEIYAGQFVDGKKHGEGTYTWMGIKSRSYKDYQPFIEKQIYFYIEPEDRTYDKKYIGQFVEDNMTGVGRLYDANSSYIEGFWENGRLVEKY